MVPESWRTAIHEAGRAVIVRVLNMLCGPVSIQADDDSTGHAITADPWAIKAEWGLQGRLREPRSIMIGRIITFMAGAEAEKKFFNEHHDGDGDDRRQIALMLQEIVEEADQDKIEKRLRRWASTLCNRHAELIDSVAHELVARFTLSDDDIRRIINLPKRSHDAYAREMAEQGLY